MSSAGGTLPAHVEVFTCSLPEGHPTCNDQSFAATATAEGPIYFAAGMETMPSPYLSMTAAHELSHWLQGSLSSQPTLSFLSPMPVDVDQTDPWRTSRRMETQAQCLAIAMIATTRQDQDPTQWLAEADAVGQSDEGHWSETSMKFWGRQALGGRVGDCNTAIAAPELMRY